MDDQRIIDRLVELKRESGNHSPSLVEIKNIVGRDPVEIDACFLSNPYATNLIYESNLIQDISKNFFKMVESYPPNQAYVLSHLEKIEGINPQNTIVLSGAQACIEVLMSKLEYKNCLIPIPTYSSYFESCRADANCHFYQLNETDDFLITETQICREIETKNIDLLVLINPNNPTGRRVDNDLILRLLDLYPGLQIIIDESFCHFFEDLEAWRDFRRRKLNDSRCFFVKSMSKDFGIAGLRIGFLESTNDIIYELKSKFGTWALNNISVALLEIMADPVFLQRYESARRIYLENKSIFFSALRSIDVIKVFDSESNFFLVKVPPGSSGGFRFAMELLVKSGLYVRSMDDKIGLSDEYIRVACRSSEENSKIIRVLSECFS